MIPRSGFENPLKIYRITIGKSIVFDGKVLKNRSFAKTMKKQCLRAPQKPCFFDQNGDMGLPGSTYPLIFEVLGRCPKIMTFGRPPDAPTNQTNRAVERQRVEKAPTIIRRRQVSGRQGPPGPIECRTF